MENSVSTQHLLSTFSSTLNPTFPAPVLNLLGFRARVVRAQGTGVTRLKLKSAPARGHPGCLNVVLLRPLS